MTKEACKYFGKYGQDKPRVCNGCYDRRLCHEITIDNLRREANKEMEE